ncbi:hypothetical protein D3C72_1252690 [compost metagenome]
MFDGNIAKFQQAREVFFLLIFHQKAIKVRKLHALLVIYGRKVMIAENISKSVVRFVNAVDAFRLFMATHQGIASRGWGILPLRSLFASFLARFIGAVIRFVLMCHTGPRRLEILLLEHKLFLHRV